MVQTKQRATTKDITSEQVRAYLAEHPDFLVNNPDLLRHLTPPDFQSGDNVVDFQNFMVSRLQAGLDDLDDLRDFLIAASRSNLASQQQVHAAALATLDATSFEHFIHIITGDWVDMLGLDAVVLCLEEPSKAAGTLLVNGIQILESGQTDLIMGQDDAIVLRGDVDSATDVFGPAQPLIRAEALVRIDRGEINPPGLLAMGSRDADTYAPGQGTELVRFLAEVVQRGLDRWLAVQD